MTVVIADTSPINYLILIDEVGILPRLYHRIVIPQASRGLKKKVVSSNRVSRGRLLSARIHPFSEVARDSGRSASPSFAEFRGVMYVLNARCPRMA
jgi:hypothetical protein